ncbi:GHKL domain-containing protein [Listeria rocourtiae]|uniref:GHKL domain-containing protein n=1 Tax=Listeria rocourtiae TaxID=647910 RepID=UPI00162578CA|nr:GHKL domain-containing protein [Listeria rocourtiae]MBC1435389.1 GHKL domain-containing protein [Listeria rocourtiae]
MDKVLICVLMLVNYILGVSMLRSTLSLKKMDIFYFSSIVTILVFFETFVLNIGTAVVYLLLVTQTGFFLFLKLKRLISAVLVTFFLYLLSSVPWVLNSDLIIVIFGLDPFVKFIWPESILYVVFEIGLYLLMLFGFRRMDIKYKIVSLILSTVKKHLFLSWYICISFYIIYLIHMYSFRNQVQLFLIDLVLGLYMSAVIIFSYALVHSNNQRIQLISLINIIQEEKDELEEYHSFRHDYKALLLSLSTLLEQKKTDEALELIHEIGSYSNQYLSEKNYQDLLKIESAPVQAIILERLKQMASKNIACRFNVVGSIYINSMDIWDFIRCIDILLNNAMEATLETKSPYITISFIADKIGISFEVSNTCNVNKELATNQILKRKYSTKEGHKGLGLNNLSKIVSKYNSVNYKLTLGDALFTASVNISLNKCQ